MKLRSSPIFLLLVMGIFSACGAQPNKAHLREEWNPANDPLRILPENFERDFKDLPSTAKISKRPWSDSYWPTYAGGLAYRWNDGDSSIEAAFTYRPYKLSQLRRMTAQQLAKLSPAEKFDILVGDYTFPLLNSERGRTSPDAPGWEGLCHGWASASINFQEPKALVATNPDGIEVPFGAADVKALLALYIGNYSTSRTYFVAERCNYDFTENPGAKKRPECRDANAGMFHLVLANKLGLEKKGFIADLNREQQVWNQPIVAFDSEVLGERQGASPGAAPGTVKEITLKTIIGYTAEIMPEWDAGIVNESQREYNYQLELDSEGKILGGAWLEETRPDFLWLQEKSKFYDVGSVKFSKLATLYRESIASEGIANPIN